MTTDTEMKIRPEKTSIVEEITRGVDASNYVFVVSFGGLTVAKCTELRLKLRACDASFTVVKNRLFERVASERGWTQLQDGLSGANGIVTGTGEVTEAAKAIKDFFADAETSPIQGGVLEDEYLSAADVQALANLPSREALYGQLVGTLAAPMTQLVGVCNQKVASIVYVLKAIVDKKQG